MAIPERELYEDLVLTALQHNPSLLTQGPVNLQTSPLLGEGETRRRLRGLNDLESTMTEQRVADGVTLTADQADGWKEFGIIIGRGGSLKQTYSNRHQTGIDAIRTLAPQTAPVFSNWIEGNMGRVLTGLFDDTAGVLRTTHRTVDTSAYLGVKHINNAKAAHSSTNEQAGQRLSLLYVHPNVRADLGNRGAVTYAEISEGYEMFANGSGQIERLGGSIIVENARLCATTGDNGDDDPIYPSYLFAPNALYAEWQKQMEIDEEVKLRENGKTWYYQVLGRYVVGVYGVSFIDDNIDNPTNAELADPANWAKSGRPDNEIGVRQILTTIDTSA